MKSVALFALFAAATAETGLKFFTQGTNKPGQGLSDILAGAKALPTQVAASVLDCNVNGLEGLNVNVVCPFQVQDYLVGFRLKVDGDLKKGPESLFLKKSVDLESYLPGSGTISFDTDYDVQNMIASLRARWNLPEYGTTVTAAANTRDSLTALAVGTTRVVDKATYVLGLGFDARRRALSCKARYSADDVSGEVGYDSTTGDVVLKGTQKFNSRNSFSPSISLKSKQMSYEWTRKWHGGFLNAVLRPTEKQVVVNWKDRSVTGDWTTRLALPVDNMNNAKISFSHDWEC